MTETPRPRRTVPRVVPPFKRVRHLLRDAAIGLAWLHFDLGESLCVGWPTDDAGWAIIDVSAPLAQAACARVGTCEFLNRLRRRLLLALERKQALAAANGRHWPLPSTIRFLVAPDGAVRATLRFPAPFQPEGVAWLEASQPGIGLGSLLHAPRAEIRDVRLGYRLAFGPVQVDPPARDVRLVPVFPEVRPDIGETTEIVWDLPQLCESIRRPGGYDVVNCSCGLGDHANLMSLAFIAHPDDDTVVWEIDIPGHRPALHPRWGEASGFLRLVFRRADYEADILAMLDAVVNAGTPELPIDDYDPNRGGCVYEHLQELAAANQWSRLPVLHSGARLEIGFFDENLLMLDGKVSRDYLPRRFTRWAQQAAFEYWLAHVCRGSAIDGRRFVGRDETNCFYLLRESRRAECDAAGRCFADLLQRGFAEGRTAPGVTVAYRRCKAPAATR